MNCKDVLERRLDFAAGTQDSPLRDHLDACAECRRALARSETLARLLRAMPRETAPAALAARILGGRTSRSRRLPRATWLLAACLLLLAAAAGALLLHTEAAWEPIPLAVVCEAGGAGISGTEALEILYGPAEPAFEGWEEPGAGARGR